MSSFRIQSIYVSSVKANLVSTFFSSDEYRSRLNMGGQSQHGQHGGMNNSSVGEQFTEIYLKRDSNVQVQKNSA